MIYHTALDRAHVWCVNWYLVLFIYSVHCGHKFYWLLGLYALHLTGHAVRPEFGLPCQPGYSIVGASVTSMWCTACICYLTANTHYDAYKVLNSLPESYQQNHSPTTRCRIVRHRCSSLCSIFTRFSAWCSFCFTVMIDWLSAFWLLSISSLQHVATILHLAVEW